MRKFKRIYYAVILISVILLITVSKQIGAINVLLKKDNQYIIGAQLRDTSKPLVTDTLPFKKDTVPGKTDTSATIVDTSAVVVDSSHIDTTGKVRTDTFTLKVSKDTLSAPVKYHAEDSVVGMVQDKTIELYGKAKTDYIKSSLEAPYMKMNQATSIVIAKTLQDSDYVKMNDGESQYLSDSLQYNFKNQKGVIKGTITQQGELYLHSEIAKKVNENTVYATGNFFTTCNLDRPHFGFRAKRAKIINKKLAVTGAVHPEFDSVPVPVYLPFGFYPLYQGRHSGFLSPSFETSDDQGLGLSGLGYYQVINDYWDIKTYGDVYSYGSWNLHLNPTYRVRYRYQGQLNLGVQSTKRNFKGDPDFYSSKAYSVIWSHASDSRSRPGVNFSGNVNAATTTYNRNILNNAYLNFQNTLSSSITYSKQWINKPFNLTVAANHSQNNSTHLMTVNLPTANFSMSTLYPLQKKESAGTKKWYQQLGIGYSGSFTNNFNFYDTLSYSKSNDLVRNRRIFEFLKDTMQWSANHSIPITLSLPAILNGALVISPSVSYSQQWVDRLNDYYWGTGTYLTDSGTTYQVDTILVQSQKGFHIKNQASFGLSFNTSLYGQYRFRNKKVMAIRHVVRPTFGLSYTPDLTKNYWQRVRINSGGDSAWFNRLNNLYSTSVSSYSLKFVSTRSAGFNFGIDNNLEMKVRAKPKKKKPGGENEGEKGGLPSDQLTAGTKDSYTDTSDKDAEDGIKKIKLIDGFGFSSSYNFLADSFRLSPISLYFRTNLFEKINLSASGTLMPYKMNDYGSPTKAYAWSGGKFGLGTLTTASVSMSTSFQSKPKDPQKAKAREQAINQSLNDPLLQGDQQRLLEYMRQNPAEFVDFNTQWSVNLSYSLTYKYKPRITTSYFTSITSSANFSGSFNLTPKWNFSVNGYYDFATSKVQTFSMAISRDLHCWQLSVNVTPVGVYRYFNFTISPKAGILQDLKVNRTRSFYTGN
ncbi:MAG: putative LPS assembly protein LptD [Niabella sp.]